MLGKPSIEQVNEACFDVVESMSLMRKLEIAYYAMDIRHDLSKGDVHRITNSVSDHMKAADPINGNTNFDLFTSSLATLHAELVDELGNAPSQHAISDAIFAEIRNRKNMEYERQKRAFRIAKRRPVSITFFGDNMIAPMREIDIEPQRRGDTIIVKRLDSLGPYGVQAQAKYYGYIGYHVSAWMNREHLMMSLIDKQGNVQVDMRAAEA